MKGDKQTLRIALCQIDTSVGDIEENGNKIIDCLSRVGEYEPDLVLFPELAVSGYPPEDLLLKRHFLEDCQSEVERISSAAKDTVAIAGYPELDSVTGKVYNSLALLSDRKVVGSYRKVLLPNYGVFDEHRYFEPGDCGASIGLGPIRIGLSICEDVWHVGRPVEDEVSKGATVVVNISASPYHQGKGLERKQMLSDRAKRYGCYILFCNSVGGQDELVFDGHSMVIGPEGEVLAHGKQFEEDLIITDISIAESSRASVADITNSTDTFKVQSVADFDLVQRERSETPERGQFVALETEEEVYMALLVGTRDYVKKNGFDHVVIGLSGGIDSSLVACIAADALGSEHVTGVVMPSPYSSSETQSDARLLTSTLGIQLIDLSIDRAMDAYRETLGDVFANTKPDITEENIQARIRGNLLMALSNKFGWLVLTTGNKSEYSVGYATLYGDMAGGYAVIKDVSKTLVYDLSRLRNSKPDSPIPDSVITRPPSAELRPDQRDEDSLPPYDVLDPILEAYVEHDESADQLVKRGFDRETVERVTRLVDMSEYKRRQAPPGVRIRPKAFGRDRRLPITSLYRG